MYIRKILIGILIIGIGVGCFLMYNITQTVFKPITSFNNQEAYIYIPSKADFTYVKEELQPLVSDIVAFETLAKKLGYTKRVKGGKYIIRKGMNSNDIVKTLLDKSILVGVEVPAGKTSAELAKIIALQIEATESNLLEILTKTIKSEKVQGTYADLQYVIKPGTYRVPWNTTAEDFKSKMRLAVKKPTN